MAYMVYMLDIAQADLSKEYTTRDELLHVSNNVHTYVLVTTHNLHIMKKNCNMVYHIVFLKFRLV